MSKLSLLESAQTGLELKKRYQSAKLAFYKPCCRIHQGIQNSSCPQIPCIDSKHTKFHLSNKKIRICFGSNRSGKTFLGLSELLMMACCKYHPYRKTKNPENARYRIYASDFGVIEKFTLPLVKEWIPQSALKGSGNSKEEAWENSWDEKYHILYLKNNSFIDFMSYDQDLSKSESVALDGIWGDEEMPESVFAACLARSISRGSKIWLTVTPLYGMTWAMKFMEMDDASTEVFRFDIYDNPHLHEKDIDEFAATVPEHEKEARLHGRFLELQGLVYKELRSDIHLIEHKPPSSGEPIVFAMDPHPRKPTVMVWAYVTPQGDIVFFDELEAGGSARDIVRLIYEKESRFHTPTMLRLIDPAAKAQGSTLSFQTDTLREFEREGVSFTLADNSEAGYNIVHEYLSYDVKIPLGPMNRPQCYFTRNASKTWYGMTHLMWDDYTFNKNQKDPKERIRPFKKDFPDCVRYVLAYRPSMRNLMHTQPMPTGNYQRMKDHFNYDDGNIMKTPPRWTAGVI